MKTAIFAILFFAFSLSARTLVVLNDSSAVSSEFITLGQIAVISGEHKRMLDTIVVGASAPAGHSRFLMRRSINLPAEIRNSIEIQGLERVKIHTLSQSVSFSELAKRASVLLADSLRNTENIKSEILFEFNQNASVNIPLGDFEVELGRITQSQLRGRVIIPLVIVQNNGERRTRVSINAVVRMTANVVVAAKNLARHEKVAPFNLEMRMLDITTLQGTPLFEMPHRDEFMVIGAIREGTVLTERHIAPRPIIEQGSPVRMTTGAGRVNISIWGRARQSGGIGDIIAVENIESNKVVRARVVSAGVVEIIQGARI